MQYSLYSHNLAPYNSFFSLTESAGSVEYAVRIPADGKDPASTDKCPEYDTKLSDREAPTLKL